MLAERVVGAVNDVVEKMTELLKHVAKCRLRACDSHHLLVAKREDFRHLLARRQFAQAWPQTGFDYAASSAAGASRPQHFTVPCLGT